MTVLTVVFFPAFIGLASVASVVSGEQNQPHKHGPRLITMNAKLTTATKKASCRIGFANFVNFDIFVVVS